MDALDICQKVKGGEQLHFLADLMRAFMIS
jgi:hypothetical protein